jgi:hypothetical protein
MEKTARIGRRQRTPVRRGFITSLIMGGLLLSLVLGCGGSAERSPEPEVVIVEKMVEAEEGSFGAPAMSAADEAPAPLEAPAAESGQATERLIIRSGNLSMVVEDTRGARASIEEMVAELAAQGAFVISAEEYGGRGGNQPRITMSIRVPAAQFEVMMGQLADLAREVTSRNESAQDVTEEYVDLEARLESLEAARQRLLGIMEEARTTKDLLEAEQQLTRREAEIESIKGRMKYLSQSAQLSSIWIELEPYILSQPVEDRWRPAETVRRAFESLLASLRGFGSFVIFFAIAILPWLLLVALVIYVIVWVIRRRTRARDNKGAADG